MKKNVSIIFIAFLLLLFSYDRVEATEVAQNENGHHSKVMTIDSWMPDKNLQQAVASSLDIEVSDLTKELLQGSSIFVPYKGSVAQDYLSKYLGDDSEVLNYYQSIKDFTGLEYAKGVNLSIAATHQDDFKQVTVPRGIVLESVNSSYALGNYITDIVDFYQTFADKFTFNKYFSIYLSLYHMYVSEPITLTKDNYSQFTIDTKKYWRGVSEFSTVDNIQIDNIYDGKFFLEYGGMIRNYFGENIEDNSESFLEYKTSIDDNYKVTFELDREESTYSTTFEDLKGKTTATDQFYTWREMNHQAALRDSQGASFKTAEGVQVNISCNPQFLIPLSFQ